MTDTPKPLTAYEVAAIETWAASYFSPPFQHMAHGYFLRLIATLEQQAEQIEKLRGAAKEVVDDVLLAGAVESRFGPNPPQPSSTTAKLIRLREALAVTEPVND